MQVTLKSRVDEGYYRLERLTSIGAYASSFPAAGLKYAASPKGIYFFV